MTGLIFASSYVVMAFLTSMFIRFSKTKAKELNREEQAKLITENVIMVWSAIWPVYIIGVFIYTLIKIFKKG